MSTLDKSIITPSEASGIAQAAFDTVNSLLPFSNVFPMKSNDGQTTVSWTPVIPADATSAVDFRAWVLRSAMVRPPARPLRNTPALSAVQEDAHYRT